MDKEIERKFLVEESPAWRDVEGVHYRQGYIFSSREKNVRVRLAGEHGYLTVKGQTVGAARPEFEYAIPPEDAQEMLECLCARPLIEKIRRKVVFAGQVWEVDEFMGDNRGLLIAEIELADEEQRFALPPWVTHEVTGNPRYYNANLVSEPYCNWSDKTR